MTVAKETIRPRPGGSVVTSAGRLVASRCPMPLKFKERPDNEGATEHRGNVQADHGDDGEHGVAQRVDEDDAELRQALGAGGTHVLLVEVVHHRGTHVARVGGDCANRERADGRTSGPLHPHDGQVLILRASLGRIGHTRARRGR